jgi:primosomal protein N' (replication factor Y) (superfamily II helicase)
MLIVAVVPDHQQARILGPAPLLGRAVRGETGAAPEPPPWRAVVTLPRPGGAALAAWLHAAAAARSARREPAVRVQVDPEDL